MARIAFVEDYIFTPPEDRRVSIKYLAGKTYDNVRRVCADAVIESQKGFEVKVPSRRRKAAS